MGLRLNPTPDNLSYSGISTILVAGEAFTFGEQGRIAADGKVYKGKADNSATMPVTHLALGSIAAGSPGLFLLYGYARNSAWSFTVGGFVYPSEATAGGITQTAPTGAGEQVQYIGQATPLVVGTATTPIIFFNPDLTVVEALMVIAAADVAGFYSFAENLSKGTGNTLNIPEGAINIGGNGHGYLMAPEADWAPALAANRDSSFTSLAAGTNYYVYACQQAGDYAKILASLNSTYPNGYDATNSRKIGGFHTLCANAGTISGHPLTGYLAADILPDAVWCLSHRPRCSPEGMVWSDQAKLWVDIYLQSGTGAATASANGATIADTRTWMDHVDDLAAVGKRLLRDHEFQIIAEGSNQRTNISGSADPVTTGGHSDTAGRRMISNIGCEDCTGAMWQWLLDQSYRFDADVSPTFSAASRTLTAYHAASPGGNPIYLKYSSDGTPYLCCNMATDAVDKILTFGSAFTVRITHDANAAVGSYQVYFDEDAAQPSRLLCALPGLKSEYLKTSDPTNFLKIAYNAAPGTPGVAINFDDGADERLEFISPTSANGTLDLAFVLGPAWAYYDLGSKGQLYHQGTYGEVKLLAGGVWTDGVNCGSRCRGLHYQRWRTNTTTTARGCSEPM